MVLNISEKQPVALDDWKVDQIRSLRDSGLSSEEIADQVDLDVEVIKEVLRLLD